MVRISRPTEPCTVQIFPKTDIFVSGTVTLPYSAPFNKTVRVDKEDNSTMLIFSTLHPDNNQ
jgi:hypothetical protein